MPPLSPRFVALPAVALAVIFALSQAHGSAGVRSADPTPATQQVLADNGGATLTR
jgi:hypothetical protein